MSGKCVQDAGDQWVENPKSECWNFLERSAVTSFPEPTRGRTLLLIRWPSPHYLGQLSPDEQAGYAAISRCTVRRLGRLGFAALEFGADYTPADYADVHHLAESGGVKLAEEVATQVRDLARCLGYLTGGKR
jgi:hypothetical protein